MTDNDAPIVGIDLGTTNSLVAYADEAGPHLIHGPAGAEDVILPSVIGFDLSGGDVTVGHTARLHAVEKPETTVHSIKRLMGRGFGDLRAESKRLPYRVLRRGCEIEERDVASVVIGEKFYTPPQLSAMILAELKRRATGYLGREVTKAVITVPAHFDDTQRQATRDAGLIAGLDVVRIVNEPTAAALAYGLDRAETATIAVYDLGGGTFDISILRIEDGMFEVLSTDGDTHLGGDDFDHCLIDLFIREVHKQFGVDITTPTIKQQLRTLAEEIKVRLSNADEAQVEIAIGPKDVYRRVIRRDEFEGMIEPLIERTIAACGRAAKAARVRVDEIDRVVMVGGSTRVPLIRQRVAEAFACAPYTAINPDHVVAMGAAVQASILSGAQRGMLLFDVTPLSLGIETMGGAMGKLIPANVRIPCKATENFTTFQDGQTAVKINVLQGEREMAKDCRSLGVFELRGIPPMPAGLPKIKVTFLIDQNGILDVTAVEERSGKNASVQIVPSYGLTRDEVKHLQEDAIAHAREDMSAHHLADVRTTVEFDLNKASGMIQKYGHLLPAGQRDELTRQLNELKELSKISDDPHAINKARMKFNHKTVPLAEIAVKESLKDS